MQPSWHLQFSSGPIGGSHINNNQYKQLFCLCQCSQALLWQAQTKHRLPGQWVLPLCLRKAE